MATTPQDLDQRCALDFWIVVHSKCSQVDNQESPSQLSTQPWEDKAQEVGIFLVQESRTFQRNLFNTALRDIK